MHLQNYAHQSLSTRNYAYREIIRDKSVPHTIYRAKYTINRFCQCFTCKLRANGSWSMLAKTWGSPFRFHVLISSTRWLQGSAERQRAAWAQQPPLLLPSTPAQAPAHTRCVPAEAGERPAATQPAPWSRDKQRVLGTGSVSVSPSMCSYTMNKKLMDDSPLLTRVQALTLSSSLEMSMKRSSWGGRKRDSGLRDQFLWSVPQEQEIRLKNQKLEREYIWKII